MNRLDFTATNKRQKGTNEAESYKSALFDKHRRRKAEYCDECLHKGTGLCGTCPNKAKRRTT